jgi:hypothetical protein
LEKLKSYLIPLLVLFFWCTEIKSQDTIPAVFVPQFDKSQLYRINTIYDISYSGPVVEETEKKIVILNRKTNTKHALDKSEIKSSKIITSKELYNVPKFDDGYYSNYYMMTQNCLPFRREGVAATAHYFSYNNVSYAINENIAVTSNIFVFLPVSLGLKSSFKISENTYFGANAFIYGLPSETGYYMPLVGGGFKISKGTDESNFTLGAGAAAFRITDSIQLLYRTTKYQPVYYLSFGYSNRLTAKLAINVESILFPQASVGTYSQASLNMTGVALKWLRNPEDHWTFGCYGLFLGKLSQISSKSTILPIPYIGYSVYMN